MPKLPDNYLFLNDRDIYDGLMSAKQQITPKMLREFFLEKGVFLSGQLSREKLIHYISMLNLDYHDIQFLIEQLTPPSRKEKVRFVDLDCEVSSEEIREYVEEVKEERSDSCRESYQPYVSQGSGRVIVNVEYDEIDLSKTRLRQVKHKDATIEIEPLEDNKVRIRFPDNSRAEDIALSIQKTIKESKNVVSSEKSIDLSGIRSSKHRTQFFINIISHMTLMTLVNVTKVSVDSRILSEDEISIDDEDDGIDEEAVKGFVNKAVLSGSSVLSSETYQELTKKDFYIYKLGWQMTENKVDGNKLEFEAFFSDAPECRKFSCHVAGMYTPKNDGFTVSRKKLTPEENRVYFSILERAASNAFDDVANKYAELSESGEPDDDAS